MKYIIPLENAKKAAQGSKHSAMIAAICGVDPEWLVTGKGDMISPLQARQPAPKYQVLNEDARQMAIAWSQLSPEHQRWIRDLTFLLATVDVRFPWMRRGRPNGETYDAFERRLEDNYQAMVTLEAQRLKTK